MAARAIVVLNANPSRNTGTIRRTVAVIRMHMFDSSADARHWASHLSISAAAAAGTRSLGELGPEASAGV